jgi:nucleotide-binding universal stress UspA family protein
MTPKMLLAIDGSETSTRAVAYVGHMISACEGIDLTIYHVLEVPPMLLESGGTEASRGQLIGEREDWHDRERTRIEQAIFAPARQILKEKGVQEPTVRIETKLAEGAGPDVALAIIGEAKAGGYDTVVLGKRGISMVREFMFGSVASKVVHHIEGCTIWIVE